MLRIFDKNALQATVIWDITNKSIFKDDIDLKYFTCGPYVFNTKCNTEIAFDFIDIDYEVDLENRKIIARLYSLDYEYINIELRRARLDQLRKLEHRFELFKDFESFEIMEYNVESKNPFVYLDLECSSFILHDPKSGKNLKLI